MAPTKAAGYGSASPSACAPPGTPSLPRTSEIPVKLGDFRDMDWQATVIWCRQAPNPLHHLLAGIIRCFAAHISGIPDLKFFMFFEQMIKLFQSPHAYDDRFMLFDRIYILNSIPGF